nr:MAG: nonstructural protein [Microvirus sp.]
MNQLIFTVFDAKAECYGTPFFLPTVGQAVRALTDCVDNPEHEFGRHPGDYNLMQIGTYSDSDAAITHTPPMALGCLQDFKTPTKQETFSNKTEELFDELDIKINKLLELAK